MNNYLEKPNPFYRKLCPPFPNEPTREKFAIRKTGEKGEGLVSLVDIPKGDIVFKFFGQTTKSQSLFTLQKSPDIYVEDPLVMGKVLHACDPNMACDMETLTFTAAQPIRAGDFLTMDYETTEDSLFRPFECGCGSEKCRGRIAGRLST